MRSSLFVVCLVAFSGSAAFAAAHPPSYDAGAAAAYCVQTGGVVEHRVPVYGANGPTLLFLAGSRDFCQYTATSSGMSRIHVLLETLYTTQPSLAASAYYAKVKMHKHHGGGNPASYYCSQLGGSDQFGGKTGAGGGWYLQGAIDETLEACIFPDMSSIDSWGLAYHSVGIIRGIDLSTVMRWKGPPVEAHAKK